MPAILTNWTATSISVLILLVVVSGSALGSRRLIRNDYLSSLSVGVVASASFVGLLYLYNYLPSSLSGSKSYIQMGYANTQCVPCKAAAGLASEPPRPPLSSLNGPVANPMSGSSDAGVILAATGSSDASDAGGLNQVSEPFPSLQRRSLLVATSAPASVRSNNPNVTSFNPLPGVGRYIGAHGDTPQCYGNCQ